MSASVRMFEDVIDFHRKFGINYDGPPRSLPDSLTEFRMLRLAEEHTEYLDSITEHYTATHPFDKKVALEHQLDALVDLVYIALGTAHSHGWDFNEAWRRVHAANMAKVRASEIHPGKYGDPSDIAKPPGWKPPTLSDLV